MNRYMPGLTFQVRHALISRPKKLVKNNVRQSCELDR